ncbi:MAG TPA: Yip1 family protein [Novosphingobium sp.]|nr:Yip1 family protein [Novosphingobium sp.]HQA17900.1 Yip1 family protein [Novosphingobium sp.]
MNDFGAMGLIERAKAITLNPDETWPQVAAEESTPGDTITRYALPLLAIGPVASFIGGQLFGISVLFATYKPSLMSGLGMAVTSFVMSVIALIVIGLIADFLAPKFGGAENRSQAFKLVAYSMTPGWVAAALGIVPSLGILALLAALYGLYLFFKGATPLMKVPADKAGGYTAVTVVCAFVVNFIAASLLGAVAGMFGMGAAALTSAGSSDDKVEVTIPGVGKIESSKIEDATKKLEGIANGEAPKPVDMAQLQALLPASVGGYERTAIESNGVGGLGSSAEATYKNGEKRIRVKIIDIAGMGAVAGIVAGMGVEQNREDENGYERTRTVDGAIQTEKWETKRSRGSFGTQVAGRFMIEAEGDAGSIDELKAIVAGIDKAKLESLAK